MKCTTCGHVLTSRHVVKADADAIEAAGRKLNEQEALLEKFAKRIDLHRSQFLNHCNDCSEEALAGHMGDLEDRYGEAQTELQDMRRKVGGPLLDRDGGVLGINTFILADAQGLGLAIPMSVALTEFDIR